MSENLQNSENRTHFAIRISLRSDLCAGDGKAFGQVIDSDVFTDDKGYPVIPGRRIKGCLREIAESLPTIITPEQVNRLFGVSGDNIGTLRIGDATLEGAPELSDLFHVRSQTKLTEQGCADENTLRFTRVVNQSRGDGNQANVFAAPVTCKAGDRPLIADLCRGLRHIGMNRTRGLGNVRCELVDCVQPEKGEISTCHQGEQRIEYVVALSAPITLPQNGGGIAKHIDGSSVIGLFADAYLQNHSADGMFKSLFLTDDVCWSPLYPVVSGNQACPPAPLYLMKAKYKKTNGEAGDSQAYFNKCLVENAAPRQPKPLSGKYAVKTADGYLFTEPNVQNVYHHCRSKSDRDGQNGGALYVQDSLCKGQLFGGSVTVKNAEQAKVVLALLQNGVLAFGRSKTAQYASCTVINGSVKVSPVPNETVRLKAGETVYAVLQSDLCVVSDESGLYTVNQAEVVSAIAKTIFGTAAECSSATCLFRDIAGFNTVWKLQKPARRVVAAGSFYELKVPADCTVNRFCRIGEDFREGFGVVELISAEEMKKLAIIQKAKAGSVVGEHADGNKTSAEDQVREKARIFYLEHKAKYQKLTASFIGRLTLMLKESNDYDNFMARVKSVKDKKKYETIKKLNSDLIGDGKIVAASDYKIALQTIFTLTKYDLRAKGEAD